MMSFLRVKANELSGFLLLSTWHYPLLSLKHSLFASCDFTLSWFSSLPSSADISQDSTLDSHLTASLIHRFNGHLNAHDSKSWLQSCPLSWASDPCSQLPPARSHLHVPLVPNCQLPPSPVPPLMSPPPKLSTQKTGSHSRTVPPWSQPPFNYHFPTRKKSVVKNLKFGSMSFP